MSLSTGWKTGVADVRDPISGERKTKGETLHTVGLENGWNENRTGDGVNFSKDGRSLWVEFIERRPIRFVIHEPDSAGMRIDSLADSFRFLRGERCTCPTRHASSGLDVTPSSECPFEHRSHEHV